MNRVMLHCTGTAAVEGAVLLTRQYFKLTGEPGADTRPMNRPQVKEIMRRLADAGLLVQRGQSTLTVFPPLTLSEDEAGLLVKILYDVLGKVSESLSVDESLRRGAT